MASTATYKFNASASTITDSANVWSNDANAFDGSTATAASRAGIVGNNFNSNYLGAFGTDAPSFHPSIILGVRIRLYASVAGGIVDAAADIGGVQQGGTAMNSSTSGGWSGYANVINSNGDQWTWPMLAGLGVRFWADTSGAVNPAVYEAEIEVTYSTSIFDFPVPMNNQDAMPTTTTSQSLTFPHGNTDTWNATDANRMQVFPEPLLIHSIYGKLSASQDQNKVFNIDSNESINTGLGFTITAGNTTGSDTTHAAYFLAGGRPQWEEVNQATTTGTPFMVSSVAMLRSEHWPMMADSFANLNTSANRYVGIQGNSAETTLAAAACPWPNCAGNLTGTVYGAMSATLASGSYVCTLLKNGVSTGISLTFDSANQFPSASFSNVPVAQYDELVWECVPTSTPSNARAVSFGISFASTTPGMGVLMCADATNLTTANQTNYNSFFLTNNAWDGTESNVQAYALPMTATNITAKLSVDPGGSSRTRAFTLRQNGSDTALAVTISSGSTTGSTSTNVAIGNLDLINLQHVSNNVPANANAKVSVAFFGTAVPNPSATFVPRVVFI